jgi:two-component system chemotaxis response regulator CheB
MTAEIRVMIVDDSALARDFLRAILEDAGGFDIVAEAANGREAIALLDRHRLDLVTMDLDMPVMGGLECIEIIMSRQALALPILVVSSIADAELAYAAIARGAVDAIEKPSLDTARTGELVAKARLVSKIKVIMHMRSRSAGGLNPRPHTTMGGGRGGDMIYAIASSTGGPQALNTILSQLPENFPAPVVIAQHITDGFAASIALWLDKVSNLPVQLAREGDILLPGHVYISPSEQHMMVTSRRRLSLNERAEGDIYRPSCDSLLASVAAVYGRKAVGIILTGMGDDGVAGMARIASAGGRTFAQDEASSIIYGMNRVAIEQGYVQSVLPLDQIAPAMALQLHGGA